MALDGDALPSSGASRWMPRSYDPLFLGLAVFLACLFGIYTRPVGFLATLWPANSVMLGFMIIRPEAARLPGWLFAGIAYLAADLLTGAGLGKAVLLNLANVVGVGAAYLICARLPADVIRLRRPGSMLYIALASAAGAGAAGAIGAVVNPVLFGGGSISGSLFWFATEFINYVAILPVILSWPGFRRPFRSLRTDMAALWTPRTGFPVMALALSCVAAMTKGGPGAVAFPVPALLWCALVYPVFVTAVLTLLVGGRSLIAISSGYLTAAVSDTEEMTLVSIRLGASLIALAPVTLATVMQSRNELIAMLHRSRRRLDLALNAGGIVGTWALDINAAEIRGGSTLAELLDMKVGKHGRAGEALRSASIHPADRARVRSALKDALATRSDYQCSFRIVGPHGEIHWLLASGRPVADMHGNAKRIAGVVIDVTDNAETEAALHQSNLRFQIVTESIPQIVWSTDAEGNHDYFNRRWVEFTGIGVDATGPETWKTLVHPEDWPVVDQTWRESLASGNTYDIDFRLRYHDGTYRWLKFPAKPIRDADGYITRWYGTSTDIDEAKHLELERELVAHELDHRIKNLFTLVNGLISLSVREDAALHPLAEPLRARLSALHQAHGLITGKPDARSGTLQALLRQLLRPYNEPGKVCLGGTDVTIDAGALRSMALVMHELITNSAKYGALSQKEGRLQVSLHAGEDRLTITWEELFSEKAVAAAETSGFGSKLITTIVEMQLRGSLTHGLSRDGLRVVIDLPRSAVSA